MARYDTYDARIEATTASQIIIQDAFVDCYQKSFFFINDGSQDVTIVIQGSPDGLKLGDLNSKGVAYSAAEISKHWVNTGVSDVASANSSVNIDFSAQSFTHFRALVTTASGTSIVRAYTQRNTFWGK